MFRLTQIITSLMTGGPLYLVWIGAIGFAASKWQAHPRTSMLICVAAGISIAASIISTALSWLIPTVMRSAGMGYEMMSYLFGAIGFFHSIISAGAFALLVYACYQSRPEFTETA